MTNAPQTVLDEDAFLRICLHAVSDKPGDTATAVALLTALDAGADVPDVMRSHVPLFADACDRLGVLRQFACARKFTALSLREARRNALILEDRAQLLALATELGIEASEIRGPMLGQRYYPAANLRHTHALKFGVIQPGALITALQAEGWQHSPFTPQVDGYRTAMTSPKGVEAELYQRLVPRSDHVPDAATCATAAFQLAMILCQAPFEPQRLTKRWLCDAAFMLAAGEVDEKSVAAQVHALGLNGSTATALQEVLRLVPGSDTSPTRTRATRLLAQFTDGNTPTADAALRAYGPAPRSLLRRAMSKAKRVVLGSTR